MAISFQGAYFPKEVILVGVRWYGASPLRTRHGEERMEERGVEGDHSTINRGSSRIAPASQRHSLAANGGVWVSGRLDETYLKGKGQWRSLARAVDTQGQTMAFLLTKERDE